MSKDAAMRAMREARYNERMARKPAPAPTTARRAAPAAAPSPGEVTAPDAGSTSDALCGHRSMNGRTCTRESGHAAKSHRYS